jgi:anoctamin-8
MKKFTFLFSTHSTDDIASYFGVKVALYFAWLGHYTCALCVPAVFGTLLWAVLYGRGQVKMSKSTLCN